MNKKNLKNKIIEHLENFENEIANFKDGIREKLGQLNQMMDDNVVYENEKEDEVAALTKKPIL